MATHQITLETLDPDQHTGEDTRSELARRLHAEVGAPDEGGCSTCGWRRTRVRTPCSG